MSGQTFKVGEVAILQNSRFYPELNGTEVTITHPLEKRRVWIRVTNSPYISWAYRTDLILPDGRWCCPEPHQLRKKPPKQSTDEWATEQVAKVTKPVAQPVTEECA